MTGGGRKISSQTDFTLNPVILSQQGHCEVCRLWHFSSLRAQFKGQQSSKRRLVHVHTHGQTQMHSHTTRNDTNIHRVGVHISSFIYCRDSITLSYGTDAKGYHLQIVPNCTAK